MKRAFLKCAALAALACVATASPLKTASAETLLYNPIVTCYGDGTTTGAFGVTTSVYLYNASVGNQASPASSVSYNSGATGTRLVNVANGNAEAALANNPALSDAAAQGLAFAGAAYAYSAGYNTSDGSAATTADRAVGVVTVAPTLLSNATVLQTQTAVSAYNGSTIRAAVGDNNGSATTAIYTAGSYGTGYAPSAGWRNFTTNTQLWTTTPASGTGWANTRTVEELGDELFGSMSSGSTVGIYVIDPSGSNPATGATSWINVGTSSNHSPYEFALFNNKQNPNTSNGYNVAYIADDGSATSEAAGAAGIEKWVFDGATWTQKYTILDPQLPTTAAAYHGLAGELDAATGNVALFATTKDGSRLQQIVDPLAATDPGTPANDSYLTLATASANYWFRGVALDPVGTQAPEPGTFVLAGIGAMMGLVAFAWRRLRRA